MVRQHFAFPVSGSESAMSVDNLTLVKRKSPIRSQRMGLSMMKNILA